MSFFEKHWAALNDATIGTAKYWNIAIQNRSFWLDMAPIISAFVADSVLDIGAGRLAWRSALKAKAGAYTSADMTREHPELDMVADLTKELPWPSGTYATLFCCSVLEHLLDFDRALSEMRRVLRSDGHLILSVPFLYYRHGDPYDFYRFTKFAIAHLAEKHDFEQIALVATGGLAEMVLNPISMAMNVIAHYLRLPFLISPTTRILTALARAADRRIDPGHRFATNHIVVLKKRPARDCQ